MLYSVGERRVRLLGECYVAPTASLIGDVTLHPGASVWFNSVLRGDNEPIIIGEGSNVQDGSVFHTDHGCPLTLGRHVSIGHKVMLHGCSIDENSLIGINAVVLNNARIGKYCLVGANALVTEGKEIPDYSMVLGSPAKVVRQLKDEECKLIEDIAQHYLDHSAEYREGLRMQT